MGYGKTSDLFYWAVFLSLEKQLDADKLFSSA